MTTEQLLKEIAEMRRSIRRLQKTTDRYRQAAETLHNSAGMYRELVELAPSIILRLDTAGNIIFINKFARRFFQYPQKEIVGKNILDTIIPPVEPARRRFAAAMAALCLKAGPGKVSENENMKKDGSRVWILWTAKAVLDKNGRVAAIICTGNDITKKKEAQRALQEAHAALENEVRKRTGELEKVNENLLFEIAERKVNEEALRESETKYRGIVEGAVEGIFQTTVEGKCTMANAALAGLLGYASPEEYIFATSSIESLYVDPARHAEVVQLLQARGCVQGLETEFYRKDKSKIWIALNIRAIHDERGILVYYQGTVADISAEITLRGILEKTTGALARAIEVRDPYTSGHQERVMQLAVAIAREMNCSAAQIKAIQTASLLHDIGKIYVPSEFLSRPGRISVHELNILRQHAREGYEILKDIQYEYPVAEIVYEHHEMINGTGYPRGLAGDQILIEARIITVADVVEAMASPRPYRPALGIAKALDEIRENRGIIYDERVVDICLKLFKEKGFHFQF